MGSESSKTIIMCYVTFSTTTKRGVVCFEILYLGNSLFRYFIQTGMRKNSHKSKFLMERQKTSLTCHNYRLLSEIAGQVSILLTIKC